METAHKSGSVLKILSIIIFLILLVIPGYVFFAERGGLSFFADADFKTLAHLIFPIFGLYAFFLVWLQIVLGASMPLFRKLFNYINSIHKIKGIFALSVAFIHPLFLLMAIGLTKYRNFEYVSDKMKVFALFGTLAFILIIITALTALLMKLPWLRRKWKLIHYLNYVIFVLVFIHSWNLGSDVQSTGLKYLWFFYGITAIAAIIYRLWRVVQLRKKHVLAQQT
ncbi:ferric reductase-like transmembrane domain-containing protein [Patescibacteria group bacterium]